MVTNSASSLLACFFVTSRASVAKSRSFFAAQLTGDNLPVRVQANREVSLFQLFAHSLVFALHFARAPTIKQLLRRDPQLSQRRPVFESEASIFTALSSRALEKTMEEKEERVSCLVSTF
jgi:hypothetical protein